MQSQAVLLLSLIVFLPALGALIVAFLPKERPDVIKWVSLVVTLIVFVLTVILAIPGENPRFQLGVGQMQDAFSLDWIPSFNIYYFMGMDGISFALLLLTSFSTVLAMGASWPIDKHVKAYCILFLLLETGMLGVFLSLDFFLFYVFWEVMLLPMYFLIGVWGGPRREYAAIKFFLYTLLGSVLMLIAILMLYFNSDLVTLAKSSDLVAGAENPAVKWSEMHLHPRITEEVRTAVTGNQDVPPMHTFNILALAQMGQHTNLFDEPLLFGLTLQWWAFVLLFIGFAIKVPIVPVHTWLPDAHVEAPTPISMILAGVLLKMGGYGIIRICYPICPDAGYDLAWVVCLIGVVSMIYGAFAALAQKDFKRLVAYSSVSHMGYVVLGIGVWSAVAGNQFNSDYWAMGMTGAVFQMLAHGISSAGMFFMVGVVYERVHHRNLDQFGGLFGRMPVYSGLAFGIFFAGLGLPGLCGFIGEVFVTLSVWSFSKTLAVISAGTVILTAGYILWTLQRVYLGPEYKGPHGDHLYPLKPRELAIAAPLLFFAILFGVYPQAIFNYVTPSVERNVKQLARWTEDVKEPRTERAKEQTAMQQPPKVTAVLDQQPPAVKYWGVDWPLSRLPR
ncbi:MAG TPA: NADH-quinone oxidoreductase subunit M [Pirellulales bacterium]|jgi:NADH-quinone oxidoreductase subunit M|nr:NADH-quinone oxidoreductase subunit M [Pirellulales bacterium]